ncbi:MAG: transporter substrate-binding domain-containing protein [Deltaproteobacteria bacterium]|nr:transporter substrate-binding domain-containing protein [Deltaproteobacteria bacterium]
MGIKWAVQGNSVPEGAPEKIIACIPPDFKPTYFKNEQGQPDGFIVDLLNEMARTHSVEVEWVFGANWAELIEMVRNGTADVIPSLTISPNREKILDFTSPVEFVDVGLIVPRDSRVTDFAPGLRIGTPRGAQTVKIMKVRYPYVTIVEMESIDSLLVALLGKDIDAVFVMMPNFMLSARKIGAQKRLKMLKPPVYIAHRGMAVKKGNWALLEFLNNLIHHYHGTPEYEALYLKWYGGPESYWTPKKIGIVSAVFLFLVVCAMALWRYRSVVRLNKALRKNIAEREEAERALTKNRAMLRHVLDNVPQSIFWKDRDGVYMGCNNVFATAAGLDGPDQIVGKTDFDLPWAQTEAGAYRADDREVFNSGRPKAHIIEPLIKPDSSMGLADTTKVPLRDERGQVYGVLGIYEDITERKAAEEEKRKLEEQLRQAQKMEAIGTLAGGIAHDFNNVLTPILGYTELLMGSMPSSDPVYPKLVEVFNAANRARDLVSQILAFSRKAEHKRAPLNLVLIIKESLKMLRSTIPTTIEIRQNIDLTDAVVMADPTQMHQVIMNLCTNAYHAMRATGGILAVSLTQKEIGGQEKDADLPPGRYVMLEVGDTGCGMDRETRERIFEPYFSTKGQGEGTGLGLAVVHGIIKGLNGRITVYSEPGTGTNFIIFLPLVDAPTSGGQPLIADEIPGGKERILVVDDEEQMAKMEESVLSDLGYAVFVETNSMDALGILRERPEDFDLLITDMTMPKMTGVKLAEEILAIRPNFPIILCTGYSEQINAEKAKAIGIRGYLTKPVRQRDLALAVRKVLDDDQPFIG